MDTKHLETFVALADTMNYRAASRELRYAASTLFKHIKLLEDEIGEPLMQKEGRSLTLTETGKRFLPAARQILHAVEEAVAFARDEAGTVPILISASELNTGYTLQGLLNNCPAIRSTVLPCPNAQAAEAVARGAADIGFCFTQKDEPLPGMQQKVLFTEPLRLLAALSHPLAAKETVSLSMLEGVGFAVTHPGCSCAEALLAALQANQIKPGFVTPTGRVQAAAELVLSGMALMPVPASAAAKLSKDFGLVPLSMAEPLPEISEVLLLRDDARPAVAAFAQSAAEWAENK